jgi:L-lactate dehydrogenase
MILDITLSTTSNAKITRLSEAKEKFDSPWVIDKQGNPSRDPAVCLSDPPGAIMPLGGTDLGYKGFALGVLVEALTSGLGGFGRSDGADQWGASVFLQVIDPGAFGGWEAFTRETGWFAAACRNSPEAREAVPVRMPGDRALSLREEQLKKGVRLHFSIPPALEEWSEKLDVSLPW